jgi:hypothetical protein
MENIMAEIIEIKDATQAQKIAGRATKRFSDNGEWQGSI